MDDVVNIISKWGFPIVASIGCAFVVYYIWNWSTQDIGPVTEEANSVIVGLIDRVRMLDNDLLRLTVKLRTVIALQSAKQRPETDDSGID